MGMRGRMRRLSVGFSFSLPSFFLAILLLQSVSRASANVMCGQWCRVLSRFCQIRTKSPATINLVEIPTAGSIPVVLGRRPVRRRLTVASVVLVVDSRDPVVARCSRRKSRQRNSSTDSSVVGLVEWVVDSVRWMPSRGNLYLLIMIYRRSAIRLQHGRGSWYACSPIRRPTATEKATRSQRARTGSVGLGHVPETPSSHHPLRASPPLVLLLRLIRPIWPFVSL